MFLKIFKKETPGDERSKTMFPYIGVDLPRKTFPWLSQAKTHKFFERFTPLASAAFPTLFDPRGRQAPQTLGELLEKIAKEYVSEECEHKEEEVVVAAHSTDLNNNKKGYVARNEHPLGFPLEHEITVSPGIEPYVVYQMRYLNIVAQASLQFYNMKHRPWDFLHRPIWGGVRIRRYSFVEGEFVEEETVCLSHSCFYYFGPCFLESEVENLYLSYVFENASSHPSRNNPPRQKISSHKPFIKRMDELLSVFGVSMSSP